MPMMKFEQIWFCNFNNLAVAIVVHYVSYEISCCQQTKISARKCVTNIRGNCVHVSLGARRGSRSAGSVIILEYENLIGGTRCQPDKYIRLYQNILYDIISYYIIQYYITLHYIILYYIILYHIISYY